MQTNCILVFRLNNSSALGIAFAEHPAEAGYFPLGRDVAFVMAASIHRKTEHKKCPGFNNFVPEFLIDGKRFGGMLLARFVEHFIVLKA
jgi:hypothetical protein